MKIKFNIIVGPSKFALSTAFFDRLNGHRRPVEFTVAMKAKEGLPFQVSIVINMIQWEDGSGESWSFRGYVTEVNCRWLHTRHPQHPQNAAFGWFRTDKRNHGWLVIGADQVDITAGLSSEFTELTT